MKKNQRFDAISQIGCIVCKLYYGVYSEPQIHHLTGLKYRSLGKKANDDSTIGLCARHHMYGTENDPAVHSHPKSFEDRFGSQEELLVKQNNWIDKL